MSILPQVNHFKNYGLQIVPVVPGDKQPLTKNGKWKDVLWTDDDYQRAEAGGIIHEASNVIDIDFDDPIAYKFRHLLPQDTLIVGKKINGIVEPTHYFFKVDDTIKRKTTKLLFDRYQKDSVIVEMLTNTQTVAIGNNRVIMNDAEPKQLTQSEFDNVFKTIHRIALLTALSKNYPADGARDEYCLRVAGCLVRKTWNDWTTYERESFMQELVQANNDSEIKSRVNKIRYQEEQYKANPDNVAGIKSFAENINVEVAVCGNWWNWISPETSKQTTPITALTLDKFVSKQYPPKKYIQYPFLAQETIQQWWASPGRGKTLLGVHLAVCIAGNKSFLKYSLPEKSEPWPVLYVEGEMSATELQDRFNNELIFWNDQIGKVNAERFPFEYLYVAPVREQINSCFDPLNIKLGQEKVELMAEQIAMSAGKKPVIFLDNISCLTNMQQNDQRDWNEFMTWLIRLRTLGYTVIFFHHATKAGDTSSGSNMKERAVDLELKLDRPEKNEEINTRGTQIKLTFNKWREFDFTEHSRSFIAVCDRDTGKWSHHKLIRKSQARINVEYWLSQGQTKYDEELMKQHDEYSVSSTSWYRECKKIESERKEQDKQSII